MTELIDKIVLIAQPFSSAGHAIGLVVNQTAKTVRVRYWLASRHKWADQEERRPTDSVIRVIAPGCEKVTAKQLNRFCARLESIRAERNQRITSAKAAYMQTVRELRV